VVVAANLSYANLMSANLTGANLTGGNLENTYLIFVSYSGKTVCPNGIFATASNCLVQPS
jgi:uncharacterized protein YjbI with pentapeptide repeats